MILSKEFNFWTNTLPQIENYEEALKDKFIGWELHHRLETHNSDGEKRLVPLSMKELKALGMYEVRDLPPEQLIFMTSKEHRSLHFKYTVKHRDTSYMKSDSYRASCSVAHKGKHSCKGYKWYTNGIEDRMFNPNGEIPEEFILGRKNKHWGINA